MLGCNVCLLEYRGYGHSDGTPSEDGLYMDAQAALDYLVGRPDVDQRKIIVFGRSLGKCDGFELKFPELSRAELKRFRAEFTKNKSSTEIRTWACFWLIFDFNLK